MKSILYLLILSVLWGSSFLWTKVLLDTFSPTGVAFLRSLFGLIPLIPFILISKYRINMKVSLFFLFVVSLAAALPWYFTSLSLKGIDTGLTSILNATTPLFSVVFSVFLIKVKPLPNQVVSLVIGFIAVVCLITFSGQAVGSEFSLPHALLMFCSTTAYGLNSVLIAKYFSDTSPLQIAFWTLAVSVAINGPISLFLEPQSFLQLGTLEVLIPLLILGSLSSGLGYVLFYSIITSSGPFLAVMVTFIIPFISIALGVAFLKEPLHIGIAIGLPLMTASLILMNIHLFKSKKLVDILEDE
ncbi:DMT family transporter [Sporosarcina sp. CAU 1771]